MRMFAMVSIALVLAAAGCADSPEHKLEQARVALSSGRPDAALALAQQVLQARPGDKDATFILARAQLRLRNYAASEKALNALVALDSAAVEPNRELMNLALARMTDLLASSEFNKSIDLQDAFTAAKVLGHKQADWLAFTGKLLAESEFARARLIILDAQRIEMAMLAEEARLRNDAVLANVDPDQPITSAAVEEQKRQIKAMQLVAEQHLANVFDADPTMTGALLKLNQLMVHRKAWDDVWSLMSKATRNPNLPAVAAVELARSAISMPEDYKPLESRIQLARLVLDAVAKEGRASGNWKTMSSRLYLLDGQFKAAYELAEEAIALQPQDRDTRFMLGWSLFKLGKYDRAKIALERLVADNRDYSDAWTLYGLTQAKLGNTVLADDAFRTALQLNPNDVVASTSRIAMIKKGSSGVDQLREEINRLYEKNKTDPEAIRFKLELELAEGFEASVRNILNEVEKLPEIKPELRETLVSAYAFVKNMEKADEHAAELARLRPESAADQLRLLKLRQRNQPAVEYVNHLRAHQQRFPKDLDAALTLGQELLRLGQYDAAAELMQKIRPDFPEDASIRLQLARAYSGLSMTEEALEQIDAVLKTSPAHAEAHELAARLHRVMGQPEIAQQHLESIEEAQFSEEEHPGALAHLRFMKGDFEGALKVCNTAVSANRADPFVRLILAKLKTREKNDDEAEIHLMALVREQPDDFNAYLELISFYIERSREDGVRTMDQLRAGNEMLSTLAKGMLLARLGRRDEALAVLNPAFKSLVTKRDKLAMSYARVIAATMLAKDRTKGPEVAALYQALIDTKNQEADARIAQIDVTWGQPDESATMSKLAALAEVLPSDDSPQRLRMLARVMKLGRSETGLIYANRWLAENPKNVEMHMAKGEMLVALGRIPEAVTSYEEALKIRPDALSIHERMIQAYLMGRDFPAAEAALERMSKISRPARTYALWRKGTMLAEVGLTHQAVEVFEQLQKEDKSSTDPRFNYALGSGLAAVGRGEDAKPYLMRIPAIAPQYVPAQIRLARIEQAAGLPTEAKLRLERLMQNPATAAAGNAELVRLSLENRDDEKLLAWSDKATDVEKLSPQARAQWVALRINLLANAGDWTNVEQTLTRALKLDPRSPRLAVMRLLVLEQLGRREEAVTQFKAMSGLASTEIGVQVAMALEIPTPSDVAISPLTSYVRALAQSDLSAARAAAQRVGAINNTVYRSDMLALLDGPEPVFAARAAAARKLAGAIAALEAGIPQLAEAWCRQVIASDPRLSVAHGLLLATQVRMRKSHDADSKKAVATLPQSTLALYINSLSQAVAGNHAGAIKDTLAILEREPGHDHATARLCQLYLQTKAYAQAVSLLEKFHKQTGPYQVQATNDLAALLAEHQPQRIDEAFQLIMAAAKAAPTSRIISDTAGWIQYLRGNKESALQLLSLAIGEDSSPSQHYHIGAVYAGLGKVQWAKWHLDAAARGPADHPDVVRAKDLIASDLQPK